MPPTSRRAVLLCATLWGLFESMPLQAQSWPERLKRDIAYLASDSLAGRKTGEPGGRLAAAFIADRFRSLKLDLREQRIEFPADARPRSGRDALNLVGVAPGSDSSLLGQFVVIAAHFDHLGASPIGALDPEAKNAIRNGADDNASGTAAILELARRFRIKPARRPILIVAFDAEEAGLIGSRWFVDHSPVPLDSMVAMINFDMVGRLGAGELLVHGVHTSSRFPALLGEANAESRIRIRPIPDAGGPSDQLPFLERGVPILQFNTGLHSDYHRATDDADKIDIEGELRVIDVAERVIRAIADAPERLPKTARRP